MCNKSESIVNLAKALVAFNGEVKKIEKESKNPFFDSKYASLDNIVDEIRPILQSHGLAIIQLPGGDGEKVIMKTMLIHESGEWIESEPLVMKPTKIDPQGMGSCITYARRYSLSGFLSLNTGDDDDGNAATQAGSQQQSNTSTQSQNASAGHSGTSADVISEKQAGMLFAKWKSSKHKELPKPDVCELISAELGKTVSDFKDIAKTDINKVIKWFEDAAA